MKSIKNLWQYTVILSILNIFFITAQTSHNQNIYADFNFSRNDTTHDKWTKSIEIITPRLRTVITDDTKITLRAPGMNRVYAYCWQQPTTGQPNKWGHDVNLTPGGIETKGAEKVSFVFPALYILRHLPIKAYERPSLSGPSPCDDGNHRNKACSWMLRIGIKP